MASKVASQVQFVDYLRGNGLPAIGALNAIDDLVRDILETDSHLVISTLAGDAAAGGVPLALTADYVVAREDIVLYPYYQHMGGLYGSATNVPWSRATCARSTMERASAGWQQHPRFRGHHPQKPASDQP